LFICFFAFLFYTRATRRFAAARDCEKHRFFATRPFATRPFLCDEALPTSPPPLRGGGEVGKATRYAVFAAPKSIQFFSPHSDLSFDTIFISNKGVFV
jgi:hypothetical protein